MHLGLQGLLVSARAGHDEALLRKQTDALFALLPTLSPPSKKRGAKP
jgi:hypothetical protein